MFVCIYVYIHILAYDKDNTVTRKISEVYEYIRLQYMFLRM